MLLKGDKVKVITDFAPYFYLGDTGVVFNLPDTPNPKFIGVNFNGQGNLTVYKGGKWGASCTHFEHIKGA